MSPEHLAAAPDDEGNVFDDDDQDTSELGEQAEDAPEVGEHPVETPAVPEVAEHPPETPAVAEPEEASTVIEIPRERETPRERMLKRLNALRIVHGSRPPK